jgi:hypothetical protein
MRLNLTSIAAVALTAGIAAAEAAVYADLQGMTLEANWIEDMTLKPVGAPKPRSFHSPRQITLVFGPGDAIKHQMIRTGGNQPSRTENRQMQIDKTQPSGMGVLRWTFEDGNLVYIETMFSGARRLIVALSKKDDALTCTISAAVAREGNKPVLTLGMDLVTKIELLDVKATGGSCRISKT